MGEIIARLKSGLHCVPSNIRAELISDKEIVLVRDSNLIVFSVIRIRILKMFGSGFENPICIELVFN